MKSLKELLKETTYEVLRGDENVPVSDLTNDSRQIKEGSAFFCFIGAESDGHRFIGNAKDSSNY